MAIPEGMDTSRPTSKTAIPKSKVTASSGGGHGHGHHHAHFHQQASDDEEKCLLTPTSLAGGCDTFSQSETDLLGRAVAEEAEASSNKTPAIIEEEEEEDGDMEQHHSHHHPYFMGGTTALIYSEPALPSATMANAPTRMNTTPTWAYSDMALPQSCADALQCSSDAVNTGEDGQPLAKEKSSSRAATPKSSCFFSESQPSIATGVSAVHLPHKQSFSIGEIRDTHLQIQKRYRPSRRRHYTDPVDFEGILNIIGGCSWWQIWVYLLISLQQIPHAMFNLSVVYMMYQPDHWCKVPGVNSSTSSSHFSKNSTTPTAANTSPYLWDLSDALLGSVVYPRTRNKQRDMLNFHSQCHYYDRGENKYEQLRRLPLDEAQRIVNESGESADIVKCQEWYYDQDVMRSTIVTEWNLVCDDNFKRAHAHLFYSFGFLFGCLLGGFASDRFGRKPTVIGFGILSSLFGLLLPYSTYFPMFLFIRFCGAVCNEAADLAAYILCMEITGTRYRAMVGSLLQAPWAVGYATLALIAYFCKSWQNIQLITAALHTLSICLICVLPESPRWLIVNNRVDEAERYIRRACREPPFPFNLFNFNKSSLPCDLELVKHAEQRKWVRRDQRANILHLLKSRALCMRTGIICIVWIATALVYYGLVIALSDQSAPGRVLFSGNFFLNNAIAGAIELPTLIFCVYLMKYGRKRSQIFTLVGAALFIFLAMGAMTLGSPMFSLGMMLMGKIFIQGGFNILYIFTSEMYPTVIRNSAVGFCSMIARLGSGVSSYIAILSDVTLASVPMIIFATFSLFAGTLVMLLPETRDQPLPDTLQDAVTILKDDSRPYQCRGFGGLGVLFGDGKYSISVTELVQHEREAEREEEGSECEGGRGGGGDEEESNCGCEKEKENEEEGEDEEGEGGSGGAAGTRKTPRKRSENPNGCAGRDEPLPSIPEEESQGGGKGGRRRRSSNKTEDDGSSSARGTTSGCQSPVLLLETEQSSNNSSSGGVNRNKDEDEDEEALIQMPTRMRHRAGRSAEDPKKLSMELLASIGGSQQHSQSEFSLLIKDGPSPAVGQLSSAHNLAQTLAI